LEVNTGFDWVLVLDISVDQIVFGSEWMRARN